MGRQYLTVEMTDLAKFICQFKSQFLANKLANKCSQVWGRIGRIPLSFYPYEGPSGPQNVSGLQAVLVQPLRDPVESRMKFHSAIHSPLLIRRTVRSIDSGDPSAERRPGHVRAVRGTRRVLPQKTSSDNWRVCGRNYLVICK